MFSRTGPFVLAATPMVAGAAISELPRTVGAFNVDGVLAEESWTESLRVELEYENDPGENTRAPVRTVAYLAEDGHNLYVAFEASDPDPTKIRAWLRDRDSLDSNDFVGVSLDTYDDGGRAFEFYVNPLGVQLDRTEDDVNKRSDAAWDAIWDSAGKIGDDGYVVEMRIPLNQLRFQDVEGKQVWRYGLIRKYPRDRDVSISNMAKDRNRNCKLCQYPRLIGFEGSSPGRNLELAPTITASQLQTTNEPGVRPMITEDPNVDAGLTVRYGLTPEMTASLAINPDFSQIEADDAQLGINNRFALSFEERRPFFVDGADYFVTPLQAVFTRTIANPEAAGKITSKRGPNTIASFAARDETTSLLFPGATGDSHTNLDQPNTAFVGRYSRSFARASSLGTLMTVRQGDEYRNLVGGFDTRWRINDRHEIVAQLLRSETEYPNEIVSQFGQPQGRFVGNAIVLTHTYESRDWFAVLNYWRIDDGFRADAGFMNQADSGQQEYSFGRKWYREAGWWTRMRLRGAYEVKERNDGQLLEDSYIVQFTLNGPWQSEFDLNMCTGREFNDGRLYDYERVNVSTKLQPFGGLVLGVNSKFGDEIDFANAQLADQTRISPYLDWNVNRHLLVRLNGEKVELDTKFGAQIFEASVVDARLTWQFNVYSYFRLTFQQSDITRNPDEYHESIDPNYSDVGRQVLYSWKLNPQTVFFLGYSDAYVDVDDFGTRVATDRSWFMKVGYAWTL